MQQTTSPTRSRTDRPPYIRRAHQLWYDLWNSLWFLPGVLVLAHSSLAVWLVSLEGHTGLDLAQRWPRLFGAGAEGGRSMLSAIAGSMITVVGVVFSITIVALTLAASQYSSRVLRNFMNDRINQTVLGVFVGIYAYCLIVLRSIRAADDSVAAFVPTLAVAGALALAFVGIGLLIAFIHHISLSIQAIHIIAAIARETIAAVRHVFPHRLNTADAGMEGEPATPERDDGDWQPVSARESGFIRRIDLNRLLEFARGNTVLLRMERRAGDFVTAGMPLVSIRGSAPKRDEFERRINRFYTIGQQRTLEQDVGFGIRQIVDIALKALSAGINDTTTAVICVNYLNTVLRPLTERQIDTPPGFNGAELCMISYGPTYRQLVEEAFTQIRQNAHGNTAVLDRLLWSLDELGKIVPTAERRRVLRVQAEAIRESIAHTVHDDLECERLTSKGADVLLNLSHDP